MIFLIPLLWSFCASSHKPAILTSITNNSAVPLVVYRLPAKKSDPLQELIVKIESNTKGILELNLEGYSSGMALEYDAIVLHYETGSTFGTPKSYIAPTTAGERFGLIVTGICSIQRIKK